MIRLLLLLLLAGVAHAADVYVPEPLKSRIPPPDLESTSWVLQDQKSGWIIAAKEPDLRVDPASISKLMTAYVVFDAIARGTLNREDTVLVSEKAWKTEGSRMFVDVNSRVSVDDLLKGLIVQSGNDAAVALAEHIAGSEEGFAELMNQAAADLGLTNTRYRNSTGLPEEGHYSTARDISELSRALIRDFPDLYGIYSIKSFEYNGITQRNRNVLLWRDDAVDGVKTGHTSSAGYCLVGSAEKEGMRLIATVMGTASTKYRAEAVYSLLSFGFSAYEGFRVYDGSKPVATPEVFKGERDRVDAVVAAPLYVTVAKGSADTLGARVDLESPLVAPIEARRRIGSINLFIDGETIGSYPLVAAEAVAEGSWLGSMLDSVRLLFH